MSNDRPARPPQTNRSSTHSVQSVTNLIRLECYKARKEEEEVALRVLVAEDEEGMVAILRVSLESMGHEVIDVAVDGMEAVEKTLRRKPDLVLMDINMPRKDGVEAADEILRSYACPILFTTGMTDAETLRRAQGVNAQAYLVKPFTGEQLRSAMQLALAQHRKNLAAEVEISVLKSELRDSKKIEEAVAIMIRRYGIEREDALEQLEAMARGRRCSLAQAASQTIDMLSELPAATPVKTF